jgi:hypothetical protein
MWRWIQNQSRGQCEVLSVPASDRHSLLAYVGDVRPQLFGYGERGGTRGSLRQDDLLGSLLLAQSGRGPYSLIIWL